MKDIAEKLKEKEEEMSREKGRFLLFALFLREDAPDLWDLVVAAPWIKRDKAQALSYIASKVREALGPEQLTKLSRIVLIDEENPALDALQPTLHVEHGMLETQNTSFSGLPIKHAYIITSRR
jgi:hypothetical protein